MLLWKRFGSVGSTLINSELSWPARQKENVFKPHFSEYSVHFRDTSEQCIGVDRRRRALLERQIGDKRSQVFPTVLV